MGDREKAIHDRIDSMPSSMRKTYGQAVGLDGARPSRPAAVKAMCQECAGYERATVRDCTSLACPLWPHRPYQEKTDG